MSTDTVADSIRLVESLGLTFPVLSDPDLELIGPLGLTHEDAFGAGERGISRPALICFDGDGRVSARFVTDNWRRRAHEEEIMGLLGGE